MKLEPGTRDARNLYRAAETATCTPVEEITLPPKLARFDYYNRTAY